MRYPLVYALHSSQLYGTERMALNTAVGLSDVFEPVFLAPAGPFTALAQAHGFPVLHFDGSRQFASHLRRLLSHNRRLAFLSTAIMHSAVCLALNAIYRRKIGHLHMVHGGASEKLSYGRKRLLNNRPVWLIAVSRYVRDRLIAHGVRSAQTLVIENFMTNSQILAAPRREAFMGEGLRRLIVISRLDPEKQVGLLLDALTLTPALRGLETRIFGSGWQAQSLRHQSSTSNLEIQFEGFSAKVPAALAQSDLLVHLCPVEPFGLAILEAFAAGVPVLVPDSGGAASLVVEGHTGFHFKAGNALSLSQRLSALAATASESFNSVVTEARAMLETRFAEAFRIADYRKLLLQELA